MSIKENLANRMTRNRATRAKRFLNFNDSVKNSDSILFLMPRVSMEFYQARTVVESFMRYFRRVVLLVTDNMRDLATYRNEIIVVSHSDETWLKLPNHDLISRLQRENFDMACDLSFSEDLFMSYLCFRSDAKVTVGFTKKNAEPFYDLQVRARVGEDIKRAYELLTNTIKMFKEK